MANTDHYIKQISQILGVPHHNLQWKFEVKFNTLTEAKQILNDLRMKQKQLQQVKKMLGVEIKAIQQSYRNETAKVQPSLLLSFLSGKGRAKSRAADQKRQVAQSRDNAVSPYEHLKLTIDNILVSIDGIKMKVEMYIQQNK